MGGRTQDNPPAHGVSESPRPAVANAATGLPRLDDAAQPLAAAAPRLCRRSVSGRASRISQRRTAVTANNCRIGLLLKDQGGPQSGPRRPGPGLLATSGRHRPGPAGHASESQDRKTSGLRPEPRPSSEIRPRITSPGTTRATSLPGRGQGRSGRALHLVPVWGGWPVYDCPTRRSA